MEQDKNQQTMFLTSLLLANSDAKSDSTRAKQLIRSKISSVIQNHEQNLNDVADEVLPFGCGGNANRGNQVNFNTQLALRGQLFSEPHRIKSGEIQREMLLDFAQSKYKHSVGFKTQHSPINQPAKTSVKDLIKKVLCEGR